MWKGLLLILSIWLLFSCFKSPAFAAPRDQLDPQEIFLRGKVIKIIESGIKTSGSLKIFQEKAKIQLLEGSQKNKIITVERSSDPQAQNRKIQTGDILVVDSKPDPTGTINYTIYEPYRLNTLWFVLAGFLLFVIVIGGKRGVGALIGLVISLIGISQWIVPQILSGQDPLRTCIIGACGILVITTYIAHGFSLKTTIAVLSTTISIIFTGWFAIFLVKSLHAFGLGNEDIYALQVGATHPLNAQGLLLGGIIIGTLGALNDMTTTQAITIFTFVKENSKQKFTQLFSKGMDIGKEHIASLINTLVLAYAGSSLAVFIFFDLNPAHLPWWVILNNETTIEQIIQAIVGSSTLVLAVPITTALAAWVALRGLTFIDFFYPVFKELNLVTEKKRPSHQ
jgi:uncharacterized membrane protein